MRKDSKDVSRRDFLKLAGLGGGVVFASGLSGWSLAAGTSSTGGKPLGDFYFVQLSDSHWGFQGPPNPDARGTLAKAVAAVNALPIQPDFIVFTGDLTHTTDDPAERRRRMAEFRDIVSKLTVQQRYFMPGEHDASLDRGAAFQEYFGKTHYSFDHKGVHFLTIDNVSDPRATIGDEQLSWIEADLKQQQTDSPIVVLTHRPLFDLYPQWDWATRDGDKAVALLMPYRNVTVFYGHIHQEHHHMTGHIAHHAAKSLMFPLPAPGSQPKREPIAWDPAQPYRGLGVRTIETGARRGDPVITELPIMKS
ncbi:metallophosphoesterase family protein [Undibacterium arcticum]|uniref:Metallophosphoesterase family protein n=1 Tax=Undibacterium arcticum TaxID=1762892 RepID=A0ABV7FA47_9BURK